mgnify:CR=1 FL=1
MPINLKLRDDLEEAVAAYKHYDVLLVNPIRDGLNLVAKEGPMLNEHDGQLVLSTEAGAWPETLRDVRLSVNVTAADLAQDDFVTLLFDMIDQSGFPRDRLTVEITESGLIENIDLMENFIFILKSSKD